MHREPDILEFLAHVAEVGVDDLAGEHFVSRADDLDAHAVLPIGGEGAILDTIAGLRPADRVVRTPTLIKVDSPA
jgi:hypothetical protein